MGGGVEAAFVLLNGSLGFFRSYRCGCCVGRYVFGCRKDTQFVFGNEFLYKTHPYKRNLHFFFCNRKILLKVNIALDDETFQNCKFDLPLKFSINNNKKF